MKYLIALVLIAIALLTLRHYMPKIGESVATGVVERDGVMMLGDCTNTSNCEVSSGGRSSKSVDEFSITLAPAEAVARMARIVESVPGMKVEQYNERYLHATSTSKIMRFVDDVEFLINDNENALLVRSASRLGKSDLGANAKRIANLRALSAGKL